MRWTLLAVALATTALVAQDQPAYRAHADMVVVHALVEDGRGAAVADLSRDHFLVYEDNYPQQLSVFSAADAPATIGLLIDNSTSMAPKREMVVTAAVQFAELSNPQDEIFVLAFNETVREAWEPRVIEESDISILRATLLDRISARGKTALYDAVNLALDRFSDARHTRQVMVVISDGSDNASRSTRAEMLARLQASHAMVYTVVMRDPLDPDGNPGLLQRLSRDTGGESFTPKRVADVPEALEHIARDIRATYTLGYVPTNQARDGTLRKLRVVASHPDGRKLKVQTRGGYVAPKSIGLRDGGADGR
jgi:Ca-activated chloride channel family protein